MLDNNFEELKRQVAEVKQKVDRSDGALEQVLRRLKKEHGCKTLEQARQMLEKIRKKEREAAVEATAKTEAFQEAHQKALEEIEE